MPDDEAGDRTEPATPRRREDAREDGRVAQGADLVAIAGLLSGLMLLSTLGSRWVRELFAVGKMIGDAPEIRVSELTPWIARMGYLAATILVPMLLILVGISLAASMAQTGPLAVWKKLSPDFSKLNPATGIQRLFSGDSLTRLGMNVLKLTIVGTVAYYAVRQELPLVFALGEMAAGPIFAAALTVIYNVGLKIGVALLILALVDFMLEKWKLERSLRMTRQEVRDELKNMEGDPLIKQRRRQIQQRIAMQRVRMDTPKADVVVTNPTHYAIALKYDSATMAAPRVLVKGKDLMATRMRQIAQEHGIPIVERPPLARALYAAVDVGQEVPPNLYRAVAEVLAYVYQLSNRAAAAMAT